MGYKKLRTPIIKPRVQGGTFYTFPSAMEDIGLNINELKNKVALSHYMLLNIPAFEVEVKDFGDNCNKGDYTFAERLENYAFNMETVLRNQPTYNFAESLSVSERVFWKFMQHYKYVSFKEDGSTGYYIDESSCVKAFGQISAGAQRTDEYGIYNETFVQVPSSYGQMKVLFKPTADKNYYTGGEFYSESSNGYIENDADEITSGKLPTGISGIAEYDADTHGYNIENASEELCAVLSVTDLRSYYNDKTVTYDDLAIKGMGLDDTIKDNPYEFNAVLLYYSIYDSASKNVLATNAYGIMLLESATETIDGKYIFPVIEKRKTTNAQVGNSYSFRLNIKTSSVYSGDTTVYDNSTAAYEMSTEFNDVIRNLSAAVETLKSNANVIAKISTDNTTIKQLALQCMDKIEDIELDIRQIKSGKTQEITVNSVTANTGKFSSLDASTTIYDADGNAVGVLDGSVLQYTQGKFNAVDAEEITVTTAKIKSDTSNTIDIIGTGSGSPEKLVTIDSNGVHSKKDITYTNTPAAYDQNDAIGETDVDSFFDNVYVAYNQDSGFILKLDDNAQSSELLESIISTDTDGTGKCSVAGLLALIVAKLKTNS